MSLLRRDRDDERSETRQARETRDVAVDERGGFIPTRLHRLGIESIFVRLVATGGIIGIGTALAAILGSQDVAAWIIGLVVAVLSVVLAALLWSSRTL